MPQASPRYTVRLSLSSEEIETLDRIRVSLNHRSQNQTVRHLIRTAAEAFAETTKHTATAKCEHCEWTASHTDEDIVELARFLRQLVIAHVEQAHPDTFSAERVK